MLINSDVKQIHHCLPGVGAEGFMTENDLFENIWSDKHV